MAASGLTKNADQHIPFCKDQGMPNLVATSKPGLSVQSFRAAMPAGGVVLFDTFKVAHMSGAYQVQIHNHTDGTKHGTVADAARLPDRITIAGAAAPATNDLLDIVIIGTLVGQLA